MNRCDAVALYSTIDGELNLHQTGQFSQSKLCMYVFYFLTKTIPLRNNIQQVSTLYIIYTVRVNKSSQIAVYKL